MNLAERCKDKLIILTTFLASFLVTNIIVVLLSKFSVSISTKNQRNKFLIEDWTKVEDEMYGVVGGHYDLMGRLEAEKICAKNNARYERVHLLNIKISISDPNYYLQFK